MTTVASPHGAVESARERSRVRIYVNDPDQAREQVARINGMLESGRYRREVGIDVETAPIGPLLGYPGTVQNEDDSWEKASKETYLRFAQKVWRANFAPWLLQALGLFLPKKTTSGKEGDLSAADAWKLFLNRLEGLAATPEGIAKLEAARWTQETASAYMGRLTQTEGRELYLERNRLEAELREKQALAAEGRKVVGIKKLEGQLKKVQAALDENTAEAMFVLNEVSPRIGDPLDLRLALHVVRVGVEGRVYLTKEGRNRLDPVQPGLDPYTSTVFLVQLTLVERGTKNEVSFIFNTHKLDIKLLLPLLKRRKVTWLGANIKFDLKMLMHHATHAPRDVFCTRVGSRMLDLGLRRDHSLKGVAKRYIKLDLDKLVRNDFVGRRYEEPTPEMLDYAYVDTEVLPRIYDAMMARAARYGQEKLLHNFSNLSWITARWEYLGYAIDVDRWMDIARGAAESRDQVARELEEMLLPPGYAAAFASQDGEEELEEDFDEESDNPSDVRKGAIIRISQGKLVLERLEELLGLGPLANVCPNGKASLSKDGRAAMDRAYRAEHNGEAHPFFHKYAMWSKLAKQASTYGRRFLWYLHPLTGRIHPTFHIAGTDTGRYSSTAPNFLNIPAAKEEGDPDFRGAFLAGEGFYLLGADYETMELRIAGDISRDPVVKKMVESGADAHGFTAAQMFHIEKAKVAAPSKRQGTYRRGTMEVPITIFTVPESWSPEQVAEYALTQDVQAAVADVAKKLTRTDAKSVTFLWLFQGTAFTLAQRTGLPVEVCEDFFGRFAGVYVVMDGYMKELAASVYTNYVEEGDGKKVAWSEGYGGIRRWVELPHNPHESEFRSYSAYYAAAKEYRRSMRRAQRELCNLPMQGGNAVITCEALLNLVERGHRSGVYPWLAVYDEIIAIAPKTVSPQLVKATLEGSMLEAADGYMQFISAGAEADVKKAGPTWVKS